MEGRGVHVLEGVVGFPGGIYTSTYDTRTENKPNDKSSVGQLTLRCAVLENLFVVLPKNRIRDVIVPRPDATNDPDLVVLPDGKTFYLQRRLVNSLFGAVFHGLRGRCSNPSE